MSPQPENEAIRVGRRIVEITHPGKTLFPRDGITKREFVDYYRRVATVMLPHLLQRPIAMERYPDGIHSQRIFQKNAPSYFPDWIKTVALAQVRHQIGETRPKPLKIGSGDRRVCTTIAMELKMVGQADAKLLE